MAGVAVRVRVKRDFVNGGTRNMVLTVQNNAESLAYHYAQRVEASAKRRVHVITGNLKRSIHRVRLARYKHEVVVGAYYGVYENYGTRYRPPHPFWDPAIRDAKAAYDIEKKKVFRP